MSHKNASMGRLPGKNCGRCGGSGQVQGTCQRCHGTGLSSGMAIDLKHNSEKCHQCHGTGQCKQRCPACGGKGCN